MGLDMYLKKEIYIGQEYKHRNVDLKLNVSIQGEKIDITEPINSINIMVLTWRKANAIHKWFVDNVQEGVDDCGRYYVSEDKLIQLKKVCEQVLNNIKTRDFIMSSGYTITKEHTKENFVDGKVITNSEIAESLLPTKEGFFFGKVDYDEDYIYTLEHTIKGINDILDKLKKEYEQGIYPDFYYQASW